MRELVEYIAKALVDDPEGVKVSAVEGENVTARAIRTILNANATKQRKHAVLEIIE